MKLCNIFLFLMLCSTPISAAIIEIVNDTSFNIFVTDHKQNGMLLMPGQSNNFQSEDKLAKIYIYTETDKAQQFFALSYLVEELFTAQRKTTLLLNDIAGGNLSYLFPNRFVVTSGDDLKKQPQQKTQPQPQQQQPVYHSNYQQQPAYSQPQYQHPAHQQPAYGMRQQDRNDISPELVQTILDKIKGAQAQQQNQALQPASARPGNNEQPSGHVIGSRSGGPYSHPSKTFEPTMGHQHYERPAKRPTEPTHSHMPHTSAPAAEPTPMPTTQATPVGGGHSHTHKHAHGHDHVHTKKSKREKNLVRGSQFMSDNKKRKNSSDN